MSIPVPVSEQPQNSARPISALAVSSFVFGIIALLTCWIPLVNIFVSALGLISFSLGITAIITIQKQKPKPRGLALAIVGTIISVLALIGVVGAQTIYKAKIENALAQLQSSVHSEAAGGKMEESADGEITEEMSEYRTAESEIVIETLSAPIPDFEGNPAVILTYTTKYNSSLGESEDIERDYSVYRVEAKAFQNGKELNRLVLFSQNPEGYDAMSAIKGVSPGETKFVTVPFLLNDESSDVHVEIEIRDTPDSSFSTKLTKTFSLQ